MSRKQHGRSPSRPTSASHNSDHGSTTIFGRDHDRYNEEWDVFDALTRAVKEYNHGVVDSNIQLGVLDQVSKNRLYVVVPFTATSVKSFTQLSKTISGMVDAEVDISSDIGIDTDAQIHFCFNVYRESFGRGQQPQSSWWRDIFAVATTTRLLQALIFVVILWYVFYTPSVGSTPSIKKPE